MPEAGREVFEKTSVDELNLYLQCIKKILSAQDQKIMRPNLIDAEQYALNLGWEDVDALDDHHIIAAALHLFHPDVGAPAGTGE